MEITLADLRRVFQEVLDGRLSREAADRWAYDVVKKSELGTLAFSPTEDEQKIWAGIMYLYGIDSKESPDEYLHSIDDIREAMNRLGL
ncbi:MAG: hypothetical protein H7A09_10010 [Oceanospirillaceae bacterium]|nr:hypothetical protein [Oceanospirillaceae bacterium]MCP5335126.1 hypothetical protein [Oceanospirillaceae bacterium]